MDRKDFTRALSQHSLPQVLLFEGDEEHLKQDALAELRRAVLPEGMETLNETVLSDPSVDQLIADTETQPFMADKRLVIVRDFPALLGRAEADERLISYLPSVPETAILLFYCTGKPDGRKKLYSAIKKHGGIITFASLRGAELTRFVTDTFKQDGKECDDRTAEYLIFTVGSDTGLLVSEIHKISSYAEGRSSVLADDISLLATPSTECTVFQMVDAVVTGQRTRAFTLLRNLLLSGTDRMAILAMLLRQYRLLQHIKIMQYEKKGGDYIRNALGVPPFAVDQYLRQASSYTGGLVKKAVQICFDTEYAVKSGRILPDGALETVVIRLLNLRTQD
ncbi:DNA polymerase III subunit delta [Aristaeella lactis]|uniref:DNA polymerase III, delta subunit n=1 Tax=Aristaeella lactis TaxID=3046383 RepID=A0AC61PI78_9FIRM|nr:DNA polymerase III subunit delta [Aristaeella lactis]QUA53631.1 DNA polymerase III subunit delta [Aristaeella lactis]SMC37828.1 DNA polymerase III, delta subunit [Aristaeella lactis]